MSDIVGEHLEELAQCAYEAYGVSVGGTTWDGKPIPKWGDIQERQRDGWRAAVKAAFAKRVEVLNAAIGRPASHS